MQTRKYFGGIAALVMSSALLAACGSGASSAKTSSKTTVLPAKSALSSKTVDFIIYATPSTPFFVPVVNGAEAAAKLYGVHLHVEYSNSNTVTQNNQIQTAIASHVAGLALSIPSNTGFTKSLKDAHSAGIPVVAFNVNATSGPELSYELGFVGQNFVQAGYLIAERMIQKHEISHGAHVFCPVEDATAVYAVGRAAGANKALKSIGASCHIVQTGFTLSKAQTIVEQYLLGHRNTSAILALGEVPLQVAPSAVKTVGKSIPISGFDLSSQISKAIKAGQINATVEQQPYEQGYYAVTELALNLKYGLVPTSNYNTGNDIVEKSNVDKVAALAGKVY